VCRIFGYWGDDGRWLDAMEVPLRPGGPDHYGRYVDDRVSLGHRRLAILDLREAANQPFSFEHLVMSYNGEVYNFRQIRQELGEYDFYTDSDTEVLIKAFHKWGLKALERFVGMFAIALWDKSSGKLHLIRDRLGVKPLYYHHHQGRFLFASELKGLLAHPDFPKRIDPKAAALFFQLGYIPTPHTIYQHTYKLEPGTILTFDGKGIHKERYWDWASILDRPKLGYEEAREALEPLLREAFELRMVADVDVGIFLSGGVDSALVSALLAHHRPKTFTIGFDNPKYDEAPFAREVAHYLGCEHHERSFDEGELRAKLPEMVQVFDEPFGDPSALPMLLLAQFAKESVRVALSADGADELFWGYPINFKWAARYRSLRKLRSLAPLLRRMPLVELKKRGYLASGDLLAFKLAMRYRFYPDETTQAYLLQEPPSREVLEALFLLDLRYFLIDDVLVKVDRASMAHSLEAREPFLDHRIVEFALRLPPELKWHKAILKELLERYLPPKLVHRPKQGFSVPIKEWLRESLGAEARRKVQEPSMLHEILRTRKLGGDYKRLWLAYIFRLWEERWG